MKKTILLLALVLSALPAAAALPGPTGASFAKGAKFTVAGYAGASALAGFPVLVRIAENSPVGFSYDDLQSKSTGDDLAFVGMDGAGLPFEIDTWNTNGTSLIWVRLPSMTSGTEFVMCWGSSSSGKIVCPDNPWSGYAGVWHMNETTAGVTTIHDSTANGLDGTSVASSDTKADGAIGRARFITSNTNNKSGKPYDSGVTVDMTDDPDKLAAVDAIVPEFTASFWVRPQNNAQWWYFITRKAADLNPGWGLQNGSDGNNSSFKVFRAYGSTETDSQCMNLTGVNGLVKGTWTKIDAVWMADKAFKLYVDGALAAEGTLVDAAANGDQTKLGIGGSMAPPPLDQNLGDNHKNGRGVYGDMDEVRLAAGAATADRIAADYATQTDAAFLTAGTAEPYGESDDPLAAVSVPSSAYTNATVSAVVTALGTGAGSADVTVEIASDAGFASAVWTTNYAVSAAPDSRSFAVAGLSTGTAYWVRAAVTNDVGAGIVSSVSTFTTLSPGAPSGTAAFLDRGYTTVSATATATAFGTGAQSATLRLEASTDGFTNVVASTEVSAVPGQTETLVAGNLAPGATYRLRVRIQNDWGVATYLDLPDATTYAVPFAVTGIGWTFSPTGSTADFSFGVSAVFDGATGTATLEYDGRTVSSKTFSSAGTLVWPGVPAAGRTATATVTVTSILGGTTYTHVWTATVPPGTAAHVVSSLSDLSGIFFRAGDSVVLPELAGTGNRYVAMDIRSFSLGEDGVTLTALEPGFSAVVALVRDDATSDYVVAARALAVCIPEAEGSGRVFFAKPGDKMNWEDSSKWTNVTDPSAGGYPHLAGDVAMAALPDNQLVLNQDATVAELYLGPDEDHLHTGGTQRLTGKNAATLTFARPSGMPGHLRFTGMLRIDTPAITNGFNRFAIGGGDGNSTSTGLGIEMPGGLEFDCGAWPDWTDTAIRNVFARARYWVSDSMRFWNIPAGRTLRISNTNGRKMGDDSQDGKANFCWQSGSQVTGEGTFFYDGTASILSQGMFRTFRGVVKVSNKQAYDTFAPGDRGGGFKFRPEGYSSSSAKVAEDATLLLEGDSSGSAGSSFGVVNAGHTHGYGSWGRAINAYPAKKWILDGGHVYQTHVGSTDATWREDGTTATQPVCIPNGAGTLCVSNGFNYVKLSQTGDAASPTNSLVFAALEHAGDGVLLVRSDRIFNSFQNSNWRDRAVLGGFHDLAVGGTGRAVARHGDASVRTNYIEATAPIVPWIVAPVKADSSVYFPGADDDTDELVLAGIPQATVLDAATDPTANVRVDGTTIALSADRTVNSLVLVNNKTVGSAGRNLGADRTLTIASGGLVIGNGNYLNTAFLGDETGFNAGTAGTVVFPKKAYVFVPVIRDNKNEHPEIWASIVSPEGAVFSYPGDLHLGGDQTGIDDHIAVNGTDLRLGTATTGCQIDVPVHVHGAFARLRIGKQGSFCKQDLHFWDHRTTGAKFEAAAGTEEAVHKLFVDGVSMPRGYYGSSEAADDMAAVASRAHPAFVDDAHFAGTGWIKVLVDECTQPTLLILR